MGSRRRCCCAATTICVKQCYPYIPLSGATVSVYTAQGGTLLASCTTGSNGCCTLKLSGSYYVTVVDTYGTQVFGGTETLTAGGTTSIVVDDSNYVCCGGYAIPKTLTLTDAAGSVTIAYNSSVPDWDGGHAVQLSSEPIINGSTCQVGSASVGPVRVCYQLTCNASASPVFTLQRAWSYFPGTSPTPPGYYQDPTGFTPGAGCYTSPPGNCGGPYVDTATGSANPSSGSPFAISFTLTDSAGNVMPDPIATGGGTVAISA